MRRVCVSTNFCGVQENIKLKQEHDALLEKGRKQVWRTRCLILRLLSSTP